MFQVGGLLKISQGSSMHSPVDPGSLERPRPRWGSTETDDVAGHKAGAVSAQPGDHPGDFLRLGDVGEIGVAGDRFPNGIIDPSGVGHGRVNDVGCDPQRGEFNRRRHRVVLQGGFGGTVGDLAGEPTRSSGGESAPR